MGNAETDPFSQSDGNETIAGGDELGDWGPVLQRALREYVGPIDVAAALDDVKIRQAEHETSSINPESDTQTQ